MKALGSIVLSFLFLLVLSGMVFPQAQATTFVQNRYLRFDPFAEIHGALNWFGWSNATETYGNSYGENSWVTTNRTIRWGFRLFRFNYTDVDFSYAENQIGTGTNVIGQRSQSGEGYQSSTWTSPEANLTRLDSLEIRFYTSYLIAGTLWSAWIPLAEPTYALVLNFLSEPLGMTKLESSTWNVTVYTYKFWESSPTTKLYSRIYFGDTNYQSRTENIQINDGVLPAATPINQANFLLTGSLLTIPILLAFALTIKKKHKP